MSRLFGLARNASEYFRRRANRQTQAADDQIDRRASSEYVEQRRSLVETLTRFIFGRTDRRYPRETEQVSPVPPRPPGDYPTYPGAPPQVLPPSQPGAGSAEPPRAPVPQPPQQQPPATRPPGPLSPGPLAPPPPIVRPPQRPIVGQPEIDDFDDIVLLGRDASYDQEDWRVVMRQMRQTPGSSNVFGYYFEFESRTSGILYVTFLATHRGGERGGPGPTYAYYGVSGRKYHEFQGAAESSAGNAVWDYLRVRGSSYQHQDTYRLVQVQGDYIPRKATARGFRTRNVPVLGVGRREYRRSTLPERLFPHPNRGRPDRGEPDRGQPDRG